MSDEWTFAYDTWDPGEQPLREALCALGNGHLCTRGAFEEVRAGGPHYPGTYHAGGYDRIASEVAGHVVENEDLVNWPNWLPLSFQPEGGEWIDLGRQEVLSFRQELDMYGGVLRRQVRLRDHDGRETTLRTRRIVSMATPHVAALEWTLIPENWSGPLLLRSALDGDVANEGVARYRELRGDHLVGHRADQIGEETVMLTVRTRESHVRVAQAARTRAFDAVGDPAVRERRTLLEDRVASQLLTVNAERGRPLRVEKVVAVHTSLGRGFLEPASASRRLIRHLGSFDDLLDPHRRAWARLWRRCDLRLVAEGNADAQRVVRLHVFHLLQVASRHTSDLDVGVPARGLHGEAYRGHVFWDELFIFPYLNLRIPNITRTMLLYRYRRLDEARRAAREAGLEGAMFPWQSGSDGREETQHLHLNPKSGRWLPDHTHLQRHVAAAIAYNLWQYYQASGDLDFLSTYGAEMLLEIARFWASLTSYDGAKGRHVIRGVMGPDEYHDAYPGADHPGLDNNAYTNVMAVWCLRTAMTALEEVGEERSEELRAQIGLTDGHLDRWHDVARNMFVPFHDGNIISQFEGYEHLAELDWDRLRERHGDIHRLDRVLEAEGDSPNNYKAGKQADVLMLFYLFSAEELTDLFAGMGYPFDAGDVIPANIDYYSRRTSHGSTLSRVVHSWVLARANRQSWGCFEQALRSDVADVQGGTTPEGIHLGAMAGTVDLVQRCYGGIFMYRNRLQLDPRLPEAIGALTLQIRYRERWLVIELVPHALKVRFPRGPQDEVHLSVRGQDVVLKRGEERRFEL
ncbi:MAG: glycoside hydrolase family 65 protein [Myxococcota bacterium]